MNRLMIHRNTHMDAKQPKWFACIFLMKNKLTRREGNEYINALDITIPIDPQCVRTKSTVEPVSERAMVNSIYTIAQLKQCLLRRGCRVTGSKKVLFDRLYNNFRLTRSSVTIQRLVRGSCVRRYNQMKGRGSLRRSICVNDDDIISFDPLLSIPFHEFFSFTDTNDRTYGFEIKSLWNIVSKSTGPPKNPFTQTPIPSAAIDRMVRAVYLSSAIFGHHINVKYDNGVITPADHNRNNIEQIFHEFDLLGNYTESRWMTDLTKSGLIRYMHELYDIWYVRTQLSYDTRMEICPLSGTPFIQNQMRVLDRLSHESLVTIISSTIGRLIYTDRPIPVRTMGAYYALCALTTVSRDAARALPMMSFAMGIELE